MNAIAITCAIFGFIVGIGFIITGYVIKQDMKNLKEDRFSERSRFK